MKIDKIISLEEITSEVTFTPETSNGEVTVSFTFDGSSVTKETDIVVFESLYSEDVEIATHTDIEDENQDVYKRQAYSKRVLEIARLYR